VRPKPGQNGDEHHKIAGWNRIAQQRNRLITTGQLFGHNPRSDDRGDENGATERLGH
jgi:hypothetical protein